MSDDTSKALKALSSSKEGGAAGTTPHISAPPTSAPPTSAPSTSVPPTSARPPVMLSGSQAEAAAEKSRTFNDLRAAWTALGLRGKGGATESAQLAAMAPTSTPSNPAGSAAVHEPEKTAQYWRTVDEQIGNALDWIYEAYHLADECYDAYEILRDVVDVSNRPMSPEVISAFQQYQTSAVEGFAWIQEMFESVRTMFEEVESKAKADCRNETSDTKRARESLGSAPALAKRYVDRDIRALEEVSVRLKNLKVDEFEEGPPPKRLPSGAAAETGDMNSSEDWQCRKEMLPKTCDPLDTEAASVYTAGEGVTEHWKSLTGNASPSSIPEHDGDSFKPPESGERPLQALHRNMKAKTMLVAFLKRRRDEVEKHCAGTHTDHLCSQREQIGRITGNREGTEQLSGGRKCSETESGRTMQDYARAFQSCSGSSKFDENGLATMDEDEDWIWIPAGDGTQTQGDDTETGQGAGGAGHSCAESVTGEEG